MNPRMVTSGAGVFAVAMAVLAYAGSRAAMRAAVLTADGHHVRLYPYGAFMGMVGAKYTWLGSQGPLFFGWQFESL